MSFSSLIRWGVAGALLAGLGWMASGFFFYVFPGEGNAPEGSLAWYLMESAETIAEVGMLAALVGLHVRQRSYYGRLGMAGFAAAFVGTAFLLLSKVIEMLVAGEDNFFVGLFFTLGPFAGWPIGFTLPGEGISSLVRRAAHRLFSRLVRHLFGIRYSRYMEQRGLVSVRLRALVAQGKDGITAS